MPQDPQIKALARISKELETLDAAGIQWVIARATDMAQCVCAFKHTGPCPSDRVVS